MGFKLMTDRLGVKTHYPMCILEDLYLDLTNNSDNDFHSLDKCFTRLVLSN